MNRIEQTYSISVSPEETWQALTDPKVILKWSGASAEFPLEVGAPYSLWDGSIVGKIVEVVPLRKLVQTWKPDDWTIENSVVTFTLTPEGKGTRVDLLHENVEVWDYDGTSEGWDIYYLGAIKRMLEASQPKRRPVVKKKDAERKVKKSPRKATLKKKKANKKR